MQKGAEGIGEVATRSYNPEMAEKKESYPMRATPSWAAMVKAQAEREIRPANNLIEWVMTAYCKDPAVQELVRRYEAAPSSSSD